MRARPRVSRTVFRKSWQLCSYNTDTTEDEYLNDIWINCNITADKEQATQATSDSTEVVNPSANMANTLINQRVVHYNVNCSTSSGIDWTWFPYCSDSIFNCYILYKRKRKTNGIDM